MRITGFLSQKRVQNREYLDDLRRDNASPLTPRAIRFVLVTVGSQQDTAVTHILASKIA